MKISYNEALKRAQIAANRDNKPYHVIYRETDYCFDFCQGSHLTYAEQDGFEDMGAIHPEVAK